MQSKSSPMKPLYLFIFLVILISCNELKGSDTIHNSGIKNDALKLNGTWEMVGYYNFVNNQISDSFQTNHGFRQIKMFTDGKVMWTKRIPYDSTEWFGYGSYSIHKNELTETLEFGSVMMRQIVQERKEFKYHLILEKNRFCQVEIDDNGNRLYSENYKRIE